VILEVFSNLNDPMILSQGIVLLRVEQNISPENKVKKNLVLLPPRFLCGGSCHLFMGKGDQQTKHLDQLCGVAPVVGTAGLSTAGHMEKTFQGWRSPVTCKLPHHCLPNHLAISVPQEPE